MGKLRAARHGRGRSAWWCSVLLACLAWWHHPTVRGAEPPREILCTTFPVYQFTRTVTQGRAGVTVSLMLPAGLGCPHDYALTPQDLAKVAKADVLVINGLGMEDFLGATIERANANLRVIDSSTGIAGVQEYGACGDGEAPFKWAGTFRLAAGSHHWDFAKVDGAYADPAMRVLLLPTTAEAEAAIGQTTPEAIKLLQDGAAAETIGHGGELTIGRPVRIRFNAALDTTRVTLAVATPGLYVAFAEHEPYEFANDDGFFRTADGKEVKPLAETSSEDGGHAHGHGGACDHQHHGVNPHLFASPRLAARLVANIAAELAKMDPEGAATYLGNAMGQISRLEALAAEMAAAGKKLKNRRIVTQHGVFDYLARDMGLEIVAVVQAHPGQEPSAAEMLAIVKAIREKQAAAVFTEPQYPAKIGRAIAREAGVSVGLLDPVASGPDDAGPDYYEQVMRQNLATIVKMLGAR